MFLWLLAFGELVGIIWSAMVLNRLTHNDRCFLLVGACVMIFGWLFLTDLGMLLGSDVSYVQQAPYRYLARVGLLIGIIWEWQHMNKKHGKSKGRDKLGGGPQSALVG